MATLLVGLNTTLYMTKRLEAYMNYLRDLPAMETRTIFENSLTKFHALILQFLAGAIQTYQKSALARAFKAFWKPEEVVDFESECDKIGMRVEIEASNCDRSLSAREREGANQRKEDLHKVLKELKELRDVKESIGLLLNKIDLAKLPSAKGATFDSHQDEHDARCLEGTRVDVLRQIAEWAEDAHGKSIFWLNGMAGTGKSTISRTVAQYFEEKGQLGASFFFMRGEGDRGNASRLFTTIAAQLATKVPDLVPSIAKAIEVDPTISEKALKEQFEKLVLQPLSEMTYAPSAASTLIIVIDALDECERERDVETILRLLARAKDVRPVCLRIFTTSRPELPTRLGFAEMSESTHQDLVLHEIPKATIENDISTYLRHEFARIKAEHSKRRSQYPLPLDWPGDGNIQALVKMAIPLFIFASTMCRFVADPRWDPKKRLKTILDFQTASQASKLDRTYLPILDQLLVDQDEVEQDRLAREFREVVGAIVILADPLSTVSLASLLDAPKEDVDGRLDSLHSVLSIPTNEDAPVRLLHLSFRDFLLDPQKRGKSPFWVDERETHERLANKCLQLMSRPKCLRQNICNLQTPGTLRTEISSRTVDVYFPAGVKYACRYWVYHLEQSKPSIHDGEQVHIFLQNHLLHWLEALSLIGKASESIAMIGTLQSILEVTSCLIRIPFDVLMTA
jgi:NACHT domain